MKPARMQMQLHVVPCIGYPPRNPLHWFITEVSGLQSFDEESGADVELPKTIEHKTEAVFLSGDRPQNNGFGDRSHFWITKIATDAELGVYGYTNLDWSSISHDFQLFFVYFDSRCIAEIPGKPSAAELARPLGQIRLRNRRPDTA
jgi:hypothetical protein